MHLRTGLRPEANQQDPALPGPRRDHGGLPEQQVFPDEPAALSPTDLPKSELQKLIDSLESEMKNAAKSLEFEKAAVLRDQLIELRQIMALKEPGGRDPSLGLIEQSTQRPRPHP